MSQPSTQETACVVRIEGMTCHSCELIIEQRWKKIDGIKRIDVNASSGKARLTFDGDVPQISVLQAALGQGQYRVLDASQSASSFPTNRPSFWRLVGLFALVLLLGSVLSKVGLFKTNTSFASGTSFWAVFVIGLVAASSSCIAISGGLLLSSAATFNERYRSASLAGRMRPVVLFISGRILSYTLLGGAIGLIGNALSPSPLVTGVIAIIAAVYMLVMGLEMLHLAPAWLKRVMPSMPKGLSRRVLDADQKEHWAAPFLLGGATFFLPCGFTQALQLYALTTGSFWTSATLLFAFALGTAPALFALGWASSSLKGKTGQFFFQFSGALVVVLGLWNIQNGLAITGHPLSWPDVSSAQATSIGEMSMASSVSFDGKAQVLNMGVSPLGYIPNRFTIRAGVLTRWKIDGTNASGCASVIQSPSLGIPQKLLSVGENIIEFTAPATPGTYQFSCSMGMYRGQIIVTPNT
ncbi:MAG: sulfite exporter TauE/SafE family protein [Patescibacteria group bacterium]